MRSGAVREGDPYTQPGSGRKDVYKRQVLVSGYTDYAFDTNTESGTVYYTMAVAKRNTYPSTSNESYNQLYKVSASATESPYEIDLSDGYTDSSKKEGDEGYEMEYVNLGTLVLDLSLIHI